MQADFSHSSHSMNTYPKFREKRNRLGDKSWFAFLRLFVGLTEQAHREKQDGGLNGRNSTHYDPSSIQKTGASQDQPLRAHNLFALHHHSTSHSATSTRPQRLRSKKKGTTQGLGKAKGTPTHALSINNYFSYPPP